MHGNRKFDVIQTLEQGGQCHLVLNNISGRTLEEVCRQGEYISREVFYDWSIQIVNYLGNLHRCRPVKIYQFLTPYTVIIGTDKKVYFLDTEHESNREVIRQLFDKRIQSAFFPEGSIGKRHLGIYHDLYSAGKTIQYVLAKTEASQEMGKIEERRMARMIQKMTDSYGMKSLHSADEVKTLLLRCRGKAHENQPRKYRKYVPAAAAVIIMILGVQVMFAQAGSSRAASHNKKIQEESSGSGEEEIMEDISEDEGNGDEVADLNLKMGLLYYEKMEDYEKSLMFFREAAEVSERAAAYMTLAKYNIGNYGISETEAEGAVEVVKSVPEEFTELEKTEANLDVIRVYEKLGKEAEMLELFEDRISTLEKWKEGDLNGKIRKEFYRKAVEIYKNKGDFTKAIELSLTLYDESEEDNDRMEQCANLADLYFQNHQYAEGETVIAAGMDTSAEKKEMAVIALKCIYENEGYTDEQKSERMTGILQKVPEVKDDSEWKEMVQENHIQINEGKVSFAKE